MPSAPPRWPATPPRRPHIVEIVKQDTAVIDASDTTAGDAAEDDVSEAEEVLEDVLLRSKRVLGDSHPDTERARKFLEEVRSARADAAEES